MKDHKVFMLELGKVYPRIQVGCHIHVDVEVHRHA